MNKVIFWHTYLVNDYKLVVQEQLTKLLTSGLYKEVDKIYIALDFDKTSNAIAVIENYLSSLAKCDLDKIVTWYRKEKLGLAVSMITAIDWFFKYENDGIILDFFAGSGTTAEATLRQNIEDNGKRKFICIQIPELCNQESESYKQGYKTISEICKERIRRTIERIESENNEKRNFSHFTR